MSLMSRDLNIRDYKGYPYIVLQHKNIEFSTVGSSTSVSISVLGPFALVHSACSYLRGLEQQVTSTCK
jgi:hypothetical protein